MPGRRALVAGKPRLLADHRSLDGREYHRAYKALGVTFDLGSPLARMEAGRTAARWVEWRTALRELEGTRQARAVGTGRRPSERAVARLVKREQISDLKYQRAVEWLEKVAPKRSALSGGGWPA